MLALQALAVNGKPRVHLRFAMQYVIPWKLSRGNLPHATHKIVGLSNSNCVLMAGRMYYIVLLCEM